MWLIYQHLNKTNNKSYIGQTRQANPTKRWGVNGKYYKKEKQPVFYKAIQKYGWHNFEHIVLEDNIKTQEEANLREQYYIKLFHTCIFDANCNGYNMTYGGDSHMSHPVSEETKNKISNKLKGRKLTEETRKRMSEAQKGKPGREKTEEEKKKISEKLKGKTGWSKGLTKETNESIRLASEKKKNYHPTEETKRKIGESSKGHHLSDEARAKISKKNKGKVRTEETKKKLSNSQWRKRKVYCMELNIIFESAVEASKQTGVYYRNILKVCHEKRKTAGKYHWKFVE